MPRKAFITGLSGQDGHYLSEHLQAEGTTVFGLVRRSSRDTERAGIPTGVCAIEGDVRDPLISRRIAELEPDEIYNLAAVSHVGESFHAPHTAVATNLGGAVNVLEAGRLCGARVYQASTSEMFGNTPAPQSEISDFDPRSPYAASKVAAHHMVKIYRQAYGVHACAGILFNHESPRRGMDFVTQKVCTAAARIRLGQIDTVELGTLSAMRDWGHAKDYVRGMVAITRQAIPEDFVLATGVTRTVAKLCEVAFDCAGVRNWENHIMAFSEKFTRPSEVTCLKGNAEKARRILGWEPEIPFEAMIQEMVDAATARYVNLD